MIVPHQSSMGGSEILPLKIKKEISLLTISHLLSKVECRVGDCPLYSVNYTLYHPKLHFLHISVLSLRAGTYLC